MITEFHIQNFKALRDVPLVLTPLHVLIGPNDSGKTSILEALAALCRSVDRPLSEAFVGRWNGRDLVWRKEPQPSVDFWFGTRNRNLTYTLKLNFPINGRQVSVLDETALISPESRLIELRERNSGCTSVATIGVERSGTGHTEDDAAAVLIHEALSDVQVFRWVPRFLALPNAPDASRRFRMEPTGFGLALCLDDILGYDRRLFESLENRFKAIFPEVEIIRLLPEPAFTAPTDETAEVPELRKADGKGIHFQLINGGPRLPASQVSDGMLLVLAYLTILHLPEPPRVLLIEEPENGIHPERLKEVLSILRDLIQSQKRTQVLLTTHSPYVVDMFKPEEVTLCYKGNDGAVQVRRLSESKAVREQIDVFTLGEIWTGDGDERLMEPAVAEAGTDE